MSDGDSNDPSGHGQTIGLVLGGGAARGLAHIGAISALLERGVTPNAVVGTSMGGLFGALLAHGVSAEKMLELAQSASRFRLPTPGRRGGLFRIRSLIESYCDCLPETFEELAVPLCVTAVDVEEGCSIVIESGRLVDGLEATAALPGLCSPVRRDGRHLVDGGLLNNLPVDLIRQRSQSPVIVIDVGMPRKRDLAFASGQTWWKKLWTRLTNRALTAELLARAVEIPQAELTEAILANHPPDLRVCVEFPDDFRVEHFHRAEEAAELGYRSTQAALDSFFRDTDQPS